MDTLLNAFLVSFGTSIIIVGSNAFHGRFTNDVDLHSVQKFHITPVPRIGGLALLLALFVPLIYGTKLEFAALQWGWLLFAGLPIFFVGALEDVTKKVSAKFRLYISLLSAAMVYFFMHVHFTRIDLTWIDGAVLALPAVSFAMTLLVIAGTIHAMNLIDGFNGLMLGISLIMFATIALVSYYVRDMVVLNLALASFGAIAGLFLVNFPFGKIFAGDSGAYFVGFLLGTTLLMLVQRNSEVSAWFPCLLLIYPIFETLFSIYRKVFLRKMAAMQPDGVHLHMLIYKRITRHKLFSHECINNSMTSLYLWLLSLVGIIPAMLFWNNTVVIISFCLIFPMAYLRVYWDLVLFKNQFGFFRYFKFRTLSEKVN